MFQTSDERVSYLEEEFPVLGLAADLRVRMTNNGHYQAFVGGLRSEGWTSFLCYLSVGSVCLVSILQPEGVFDFVSVNRVFAV